METSIASTLLEAGFLNMLLNISMKQFKCRAYLGSHSLPILFSRHENGLYIPFCASNQEITQLQQEEKEQHQKTEMKFILVIIQKQ